MYDYSGVWELDTALEFSFVSWLFIALLLLISIGLFVPPLLLFVLILFCSLSLFTSVSLTILVFLSLGPPHFQFHDGPKFFQRYSIIR